MLIFMHIKKEESAKSLIIDISIRQLSAFNSDEDGQPNKNY